MIKPHSVAQLSAASNATQADAPIKSAVQHGHELTFGGQFPDSGICPVLSPPADRIRAKDFSRLWNTLEVAHGVGQGGQLPSTGG
jgi:hypothetical protein